MAEANEKNNVFAFYPQQQKMTNLSESVLIKYCSGKK